MTSAAGVWQSYVQAVGAVDKGVNYGLGAWGRVVAKRPVLTVVGSAIAALCLSAGLLLIGDLVETESDKLWCVSAITCVMRLLRTYGLYRISHVLALLPSFWRGLPIFNDKLELIYSKKTVCMRFVLLRALFGASAWCYVAMASPPRTITLPEHQSRPRPDGTSARYATITYYIRAIH